MVQADRVVQGGRVGQMQCQSALALVVPVVLVVLVRRRLPTRSLRRLPRSARLERSAVRGRQKEQTWLKKRGGREAKIKEERKKGEGKERLLTIR